MNKANIKGLSKPSMEGSKKLRDDPSHSGIRSRADHLANIRKEEGERQVRQFIERNPMWFD